MNSKMKSILSLFFLCNFLSLTGQEIISIKKYWTAYSQTIDVSEEMKGAEFRVSTYIRKHPSNKNSKAALWIRVNNGGFFQNDAYNEKIKLTENWSKFEISGNIHKEATELYFGAFVQNNGRFYFDNFMLEIKDKKGNWKSIKISNEGFEYPAIKDLWIEGIRKDKIVNAQNFDIKYTEANPYEGRYSLIIEGRGIIGNASNGKYAQINNVKLYYEIYGQGAPLLMIHGNGGSMGAFINQVEEFSKYYKVIVVDCRGRGNSTYDNDVELTYTLQANDMKMFLDYLKIEKAHIVGWSDGGIIGLIMAIKYPAKVDKLVAMAANIFPDGLTDNKLLSYNKIIESLEKEGNTGLSLDLYKLLANYPKMIFKDLNVISSETLIMAGDHDVIKNFHTIKIFESIHEAQLAILPNETHWLPEENPKLFNQTVLNFLKSKKE